MIWNYLVTALRSFQRHKLYGVINIAGLAVGLACAIFIILYLRDELSYDKWVPDSENVYRSNPPSSSRQGPGLLGEVPFPSPRSMQAQIPGVVAQTHLIPENMTAQVGDRQFAAKISVVDPNFFQVIRLPLVAGDPATGAGPAGFCRAVANHGPQIFRHRRSGRQDHLGARFACAESHRRHARPSAQLPACRVPIFSCRTRRRPIAGSGSQDVLVRRLGLGLCEAGAGHRSASAWWPRLSHRWTSPSM